VEETKDWIRGSGNGKACNNCHCFAPWACLIVSAVLGLLIDPFVAQWTSAPSWRWGLFAVIVLAGFTLGVSLERRDP